MYYNIVRIDSLSRIRIPIDYAFNMGAESGEEVLMWIENGRIIMEKYQKGISKEEGYIRRLDDKFRVVFPKELYERLDATENTLYDIFQDINMRLHIMPHKPYCVICGSNESLLSLDDIHAQKYICLPCSVYIKDLL